VKPNEIREKPTTELVKIASELKEESFRLRFRHGTGQLKQTANIKLVKQDLARVLTELNARTATEAEKGAASA
jgi:large subunit ribosomal protein L29